MVSRVLIPQAELLNHRTAKVTLGATIVLARNMVKEIDHEACGPIKLVNTPVKFSETQPTIRSPLPMLGEHSNEILRDIVGMTESDIEELRMLGVVA
jgi:succinate---hydroxymethylglutarate CoA-transferase